MVVVQNDNITFDQQLLTHHNVDVADISLHTFSNLADSERAGTCVALVGAHLARQQHNSGANSAGSSSSRERQWSRWQQSSLCMLSQDCSA